MQRLGPVPERSTLPIAVQAALSHRFRPARSEPRRFGTPLAVLALGYSLRWVHHSFTALIMMSH